MERATAVGRRAPLRLRCCARAALRRAAAAVPATRRRAPTLLPARQALGAGASSLRGAPVTLAAASQARRRRAQQARASLVPEFAPSQVTVDEPLGEGSFGQVFLGTLRVPKQPPAVGARSASRLTRFADSSRAAARQ
jgi:hypothetical protein